MRSDRRLGFFVTFAFMAMSCGASPSVPATEGPVTTGPASSASAPSVSTAPVHAPVSSRSPSMEREPESVVNLAFEPLSAGVRPSGKLVLAAHFRIAPGYRISWKTAGQVGTPTVVSFHAPPGFAVGPVQFPAPERYKVEGGYGGIGYENETAVFVEVMAPASLRRDAVSRFDVDASWVACKKTCATEHTAAFVELATTYGDARVREIEAGVAPFRARIPKSLSDLKGADASWKLGDREATLVVKMPGTTVRDFFSDDSSDPKPEKTSMSDDELRFTYDEAPHPGSKPLRGVVVASVEGKDAFFDLEAPLPVGEAGQKKSRSPKKKR